MATSMEVDDPTDKLMTSVSDEDDVMAATGTQGSVTISLHPLVILNISEHFTRIRAQEGKSQQVIGALIGNQKKRHIEICNSFELLFFHDADNGIIIDKAYYNAKEEQFKQVFKELDFLGWYTTGGSANDSDIHVHKQICDINESPLFLKMNPFSRQTDLPISVYESVIDVVNRQATMLFIELPYTLATEEAERIGVDHVARLSTNDIIDSSTVAEHLNGQHSSMKMLHTRIKLILEYLKAVRAGQLPKNHEILRQVHSLCHRLPVLRNEVFQRDFYNQCNDVSLMAYLGTITKGCNTMNQFVNKFNLLYDRQGFGRRTRGLIF